MAQKKFCFMVRIVRAPRAMAVTTVRRSSVISVTSEASIATSVPVPMAMPTSAWARAGASLMPSQAPESRGRLAGMRFERIGHRDHPGQSPVDPQEDRGLPLGGQPLTLLRPPVESKPLLLHELEIPEHEAPPLHRRPNAVTRDGLKAFRGDKRQPLRLRPRHDRLPQGMLRAPFRTCREAQQLPLLRVQGGGFMAHGGIRTNSRSLYHP